LLERIRIYLNYVSWVIFRLLRRKVRNYTLYRDALKGKKGLEIGGPSSLFKKGNIIPVYPIIDSLDGFGFPMPVKWGGTTLKGGETFIYSNSKKPGHQFIGDSVNLGEVRSNSYDFILAAHVLEHIANPFRALKDWRRVLKDGGALLLAIPNKDLMFDHKRPVTSLDHLIDDFSKNIGEDDLSHLPEILELTDISLDSYVPSAEFLKERGECNYEHRNLHHHVFDANLMVEVITYFRMQILSVDTAPPHHIVILARK